MATVNHANYSGSTSGTLTISKPTHLFTLAIVGAGTVTPNLNGQMLQLGKTYTMTAMPAAGNVFINWDGGLVTSSNLLSFVMSDSLALTAMFRETNAPTVVIVSPVSGARVTNSAASFMGSAADASGVARVEYALNEAAFQPASGTTNWSAPVSLRVGTNVFRVRSVDKAGNISTLASRSVFYSVTSPLSLWIVGQGRVTGATNGQLLEIGRAYTLTATPGVGQIFREWSGGVSSSSSALTFLMQPDLLAQASFMTNPFPALKGSYQGLFSEKDAVHHDRSGALMLSVTAAGAYSGSLKLGTRAFNLAGQFDGHGQAFASVLMAAGNTVAFRLQLDVTNSNDVLTGQFAGAAWRANLDGYRVPIYSLTNPPLATGRYTFFIPHDDSSTNNPAGIGFGTMFVDANGLGTMSGKLGDGTPFTAAATLSRSGDYPLYVQIYSAGGSVFSWLAFEQQAASDFAGTLNWIKPASVVNTPYPAGFNISSSCLGSAYVATNATLLTFTAGAMDFTGGALANGFSNAILFQTNGTLVNLSSNKLSFALTKQTGLFAGTVINPLTGLAQSYSGAIYQKGNAGFGYMGGPRLTSGVLLHSTP